ncbi:DUF4382 domain-containing protein [Natroniella sulfidigena]|uniref:DUF4382 domain-containing protein n=1 Tax=Natroniella sulfidigena TaxID=723921 RepID=UPI00200B5F7A|nr:DUF4382 domain-containing protein [Natroniella sulfidigena]MCK8817239.1 DUF4382 domain-containing protein [Natroniella sulfidigena]
MFDKRITILIITLALGLILAGCSTSSSNGGELALSLADAPVNEIAEVNVTLDEVQVKRDGHSWETINDFNDQGGEFRINLLDLRFDEELLGQKMLESGNYNQIRLILADGNELTDDGELKSNVVYNEDLDQESEGLFVPSGEQTGLKINHNFTIEDGTITRLLLDADVREILNSRGNSNQGFSLKPTAINVINQVVSGDIEGRVTDEDGNAITDQDVIVEAIGTDISTVATTEETETKNGEIKPVGSFRLRGLEEGTYDIIAYIEDEGTTYQSQTLEVEVTAEEVTKLEEKLTLEETE